MNIRYRFYQNCSRRSWDIVVTVCPDERTNERGGWQLEDIVHSVEGKETVEPIRPGPRSSQWRQSLGKTAVYGGNDFQYSYYGIDTPRHRQWSWGTAPWLMGGGAGATTTWTTTSATLVRGLGLAFGVTAMTWPWHVLTFVSLGLMYCGLGLGTCGRVNITGWRTHAGVVGHGGILERPGGALAKVADCCGDGVGPLAVPTVRRTIYATHDVQQHSTVCLKVRSYRRAAVPHSDLRHHNGRTAPHRIRYSFNTTMSTTYASQNLRLDTL